MAVFNESSHRVIAGLWGPKQMLVVFWELAENKDVSGEDDQPAVIKKKRDESVKNRTGIYRVFVR